MIRTYTGLEDAQKSPTSVVREFSKSLEYFFGLTSVGVSSGNIDSVHSRGRAFDVAAWNFRKNIPLENFEEINWNLINFLYKNRIVLEIEEIHDYFGIYLPQSMTRYTYMGRVVRGSNNNWGAAYRCSRDSFAVTGSQYQFIADISLGASGEHVKIFQSALGINATGKFDKNTENQLKVWQRENKIVPSGIVNATTWNAMINIPFSGWKKWDENTDPDNQGKRHIHVEVSPKGYNGGQGFLNRLYNLLINYVRNEWRIVSIVGSGENASVKTSLKRTGRR
jgi:hypothetical protein